MNDLISRAELFDELNRRGVPYNAEVNMVINEMPSAQPEPICAAKVTLTDEQVKEAFEKAKCEILTALPSAQLELNTQLYTDGFDDEYAQCKKDKAQWIPCSERLPEELEEVNVTWVNHKPEPYYDFVKDKPFTASAVYYKGDWYWYSSVCTDLLAEYGKNEIDKIDDAIEITAWMPLPEPWKGEQP